MNSQLSGVRNIDESEFRVIKCRIAEGSFGKIDLAKYGEKYVAVKWLNNKCLKENRREAEILQACDHSNILHFYGACYDARDGGIKYLLLEWATNGDLKKVIQNKIAYTIWHIMLWCSQITEGLRYLHTRTPAMILHRDIKPANMLLFDGCTLLKIADFGSSRFGKEDLSRPAFTKGFAAPEVIKTNDYDETTDIYGFGMTLKCLLMRHCNLYISDDVTEYPPFLTNLIAHCTSDKRSNRPSADQLKRIFDIAFEKIYADDIGKLALETQYYDPYKIENMVEAKPITNEHDRMDGTMSDSLVRTLIADGRIPLLDINELPRHLRPCYVSEFTNAPVYQRYMEQAAKYVEEKKEVANAQKQIDDLLNEITERLRVPEPDQKRTKERLRSYAEMETERCRRSISNI